MTIKDEAARRTTLLELLDWTRARGDIRMDLSAVEVFEVDIACPVVHIAGTNGKGSVAMRVSDILPNYKSKQVAIPRTC